MKRARLLGSVGACALAALSTIVAGGTSSAAEVDSAIASSGVVAAMQRDLGLSEAQAVTRLAQESVAIEIEPAARDAAGAAYGGSWFDPASGSLVVGLATPDPAAAAAVRATGAGVATVAHTQAELDAVKAKLDAVKAPADVAGWRVDPRSGSVVVTIRRGAAAGPVRADAGTEVADFLDLARKAGPVTVEETDQLPRPFSAGTVGGDSYYINGNTRCSIGFSVHGGFVSAGHCGGVGSSVVGWDGSWMGTFAGSSFPGNDYSFIRIGNGWWGAPVVLGWGTVPDRLVRGSGEAPVGSSICRSGSTTHWHCGTVLAKNETVNYAQGAVYQMTKTSVCAEPGDSGGSFITGDQAQGMTSGGWGNCSSGGQTWFQPVNEVLGVYGLSLVTA
ncbi:MAG: trypsin-like serine protease [Actinophytocola sp.]|uniref:S1 family peptidase n=1 Tax=Actinophytocola sp. TaxID=1872138 RepID=UPI00132482EE|nr:S1 family peptidase [Actinophytocola sp.]MPZ80195.1 trypsin-like serine protease [Actinophytocola sp.]